MEARFKHDCEKCTFLGQHEDCDLYFCDQSDIFPTVIARWGDDGPEYHSGLNFANHIPALGEAARRARARGFIE